MKTIYCLFAWLFLYQTSNAQWVQTNGPECGFTYDFEVAGPYLFASSEFNGVFRSSNSGVSWSKSSSGLPQSAVLDLAVIGSTLFAGTIDGVYKSDDFGLNWIPANTGIANINVTAFATDGLNLYAGSEGNGIFFSNNNGNTWTSLNNGLGDLYVREIEINSTAIYVGTLNGTYVSITNGAQWNLCASSVGLVEALSFVSVGTSVYAGDISSNVYVTNDNGVTWSLTGSPLPNIIGVQDLLESSGILYAATSFGMYISSDFGVSWNPSNVNSFEDLNCWRLFEMGNKIFTGTFGGGIYYTVNNGANWIRSNTGYIDSDVTELIVHQNNLYASTNGGGIYMSTDQGITWNTANSGITSMNITGIISQGNDLFCVSPTKIFKSIDHGATWTDLQVASSGIYGPTTIYNYSGFLYVGTGGVGVFKSINGGNTWTSASNGIPSNAGITKFSSIGNYLFASSFNGVYVSTNNGISWGISNNGLTVSQVNNLKVNGNTLFAGTYAGIFKTTNFGGNWVNLNNGVLPTFNMSVEVVGSSVIAGYNNGDIFISNDDGLTWVNKNLGPSNYYPVTSFVTDGNNLYAGTYWGGVFKDSTFVSGLSAAATINSNLALCPNPAVDFIELTFPSDFDSNSFYEICNAIGQTLMIIPVNHLTGANDVVKVDISELPSGIYIISAKDRTVNPVKFIKL